MNNSLSAVVFEYLQATVEAEDINSAYSSALSTAKSNMNFLENVLSIPLFKVKLCVILILLVPLLPL
ncbi:hypothetical protein V7152_18740 [Neobacillus drentensis]|uniref:hypothetical protein n=1 Tax=Neobacillus drentensis TaxID=220684 RepID=UPI0030006DD2